MWDLIVRENEDSTANNGNKKACISNMGTGESKANDNETNRD